MPALRSVLMALLSRGMAATVPPRVCVIGAGASGLCAARRCRESGLHVEVFEQKRSFGGVWNYEKGGVMYRDLVSNLPKEIMCYNRADPFPEAYDSFVTHSQVQQYLSMYLEKHSIADVIHFDRRVSRLESAQGRWRVFATDSGGKEAEMGVFDGVLACSGHFERPSRTVLPGLEAFLEEFGRETEQIRSVDGKLPLLVHSRAYDSPEIFENKRVLVVGAKASGTDVGREIATTALEVGIVNKDQEASEKKTEVITVRPLVSSASVRGSQVMVDFTDGTSFEADCIVFATGYDYVFDFVADENVHLETTDRRVFPLYMQLFHADHPSLMFLGIPHSVVPFPLFDLQAQLCAKYLADPENSGLPSAAKMREAAEELDRQRRESGQRDRDAHLLGSKQWRYNVELLKHIRLSPEGEVKWQPEDRALLEWLYITRQVYEDAGSRRPSWPGAPDDYRRTQYRIKEDGSWHCLSPEGEILGGGDALDPAIGLDEAADLIARLEDDPISVLDESAMIR